MSEDEVFPYPSDAMEHRNLTFIEVVPNEIYIHLFGDGQVNIAFVGVGEHTAKGKTSAWTTINSLYRRDYDATKLERVVALRDALDYVIKEATKSFEKNPT